MIMDISVIIPVFNRRHIVVKAITSVLNQTHSPNEIIIVDDGSSDSLKTLIDTINDSRIKYVYQENKGVSSARNLGISLSACKWLAFLDSDDHWLPKKLKKQTDFHRDHPNILISQTDEVWIKNGKRINPKKYHKKTGGDIFLESLARCLITPSAVMVNKALLASVGLFDEDLPACEDYDIWLRLTSNNQVGLINDKLVVKTGGHCDQLSKKYWGMDRFRVTSLEKILDHYPLSPVQMEKAIDTILAKSQILLNGARKRERADDVLKYESIIMKYEKVGDRL